MNNSTKLAIRNFYISKYLSGIEMGISKYLEICKTYKVFKIPYTVSKKEEYGSSIGKRNILISERQIKVKPLILSTKEVYLENNFRIYSSDKLPGVSLYYINNRGISIPWWRTDKFGNTNPSFFVENIPENRINKKLKQYDYIIHYLRIYRKLKILNQEELPIISELEQRCV